MHTTNSIRQLVFDEKVALGFEMMTINSADARSKQNLRWPHRASFYAIILFTNGNPVHMVDFAPVQAQPDSFLFIGKNAVQFFDQLHTFESQVLIFTDAFYCRNENDPSFLQETPLFNNIKGTSAGNTIPSTKAMKKIWTQMEAEAQQPPDRFQSGLLQHYLSSFMLLAERQQQQSGFKPYPKSVYSDHLIEFKILLEQNFRKEKTVRYYAEKQFISAKVLTRAVQNTTGRTPKQLIDERIVLEAKRLLIYSNDSAKTIALSLGFDEPTNFNKFFRQQTATTPSQFRAAMR